MRGPASRSTVGSALLNGLEGQETPSSWRARSATPSSSLLKEWTSPQSLAVVDLLGVLDMPQAEGHSRDRIG
jgi:hypothetical protein